MKFTLGFSPCPNDTFIFDALVNQKIDTEGLEFDTQLEDVETLNQWALQGKLDITKLSFPAFFQSLDNYQLMQAGSALGMGVGPLLVTAKQEYITEGSLENKTIVLPGENTTANLLFTFAYPKAVNKKFILFSTIEEAVVKGAADLGVIIHENRFTYQQKGLHKVKDLGEHWEQAMNVPIPLGGIAVHQRVDKTIARQIDRLIRKSLDYAFAHYPLLADYVKQYSQAMEEQVMRQHIDLYVNEFSLALGPAGQQAILELYKVYNQLRQKKGITDPELFL